MTQRPPSSEAVALRLAAAGLPAAVWAGARHLYRSALSLIEGQRAWRIRRQRIRAEKRVRRTAEAIVAEYAALWAPLYDEPHINHPNHTRV
ncbi:hypothetical protein AB0B07_33465 [Streptomyces sioyaensis]|uniref:hypothetical protein n=1 Tax=Streptomyces sioyaensis TaxID=67364 RepID=UPI0033DC069E